MTTFKAGLMLFLATASAHAAEKEIGTVMSPAKHMIVSPTSGDARAPTMGDKLFLGDKVVIGTDERRNVQFRLTDGTLFSCAAGSTFSITTYNFENQPSDELKTQITKGGCRILAGNIDRPGTRGQKWGSSTAVMGLAGTLAGIVVRADETAVGIFQGRGHLGNAERPFALGDNEEFDFATTRIGMSHAEPDAFEFLETLPTQVEGGMRVRVDSELLAEHEIAPITQQELDAIKYDLRGHFKGRALLEQRDVYLDILGEGLPCD